MFHYWLGKSKNMVENSKWKAVDWLAFIRIIGHWNIVEFLQHCPEPHMQTTGIANRLSHTWPPFDKRMPVKIPWNRRMWLKNIERNEMVDSIWMSQCSKNNCLLWQLNPDIIASSLALDAHKRVHAFLVHSILQFESVS